MSKIQEVDRFEVLHDNVFVEGIHIEERDGVVRPDSYEDKPSEGRVLKIGPGRMLETGIRVEMTVQPGDEVHFNQYSATKLNLNGKDYFFVREEDIVSYVR